MYTLTIAGDKIVGLTVHGPHMELVWDYLWPMCRGNLIIIITISLVRVISYMGYGTVFIQCRFIVFFFLSWDCYVRISYSSICST